MAMVLTKAGLPNTCSVCAKTVTKDEGWYAENEDAARAGGGVCADHVAVPPHAEPASPLAQVKNAAVKGLKRVRAKASAAALPHEKPPRAARKKAGKP